MQLLLLIIVFIKLSNSARVEEKKEKMISRKLKLNYTVWSCKHSKNKNQRKLQKINTSNNSNKMLWKCNIFRTYPDHCKQKTSCQHNSYANMHICW